MSFILEEDADDLISADDWSGSVACPRERIRRELELKIAEFQRDGGQVVEVPVGVMATAATPGASLITNRSNNFTQSELTAYAKKKAEKLHYRVRSGDAESVKLLHEWLPVAASASFLADKLDCSIGRVQRLLAENFADDHRAEKFRHHDRDMQKHEHELELAKKIRDCLARGMIGTWPICKEVHASFESVTQVSRKYRIEIPRGKGGLRVKNKAEA